MATTITTPTPVNDMRALGLHKQDSNGAMGDHNSVLYDSDAMSGMMSGASSVASDTQRSPTDHDGSMSHWNMDDETSFGHDEDFTSIGDTSHSGSLFSAEDRLQFHRLANIRQDELALLEHAYKRVARRKSKISIALIHGVSGTGKSATFQQFTQKVAKRYRSAKPYVLRGKFDELSGDDPLSAIVEAFGGMATTLLLQKDEAESARIQKRIEQSLGGSDNVKYLGSVFPILKSLLGLNEDDEEDQEEQQQARMSSATIKLGQEQEINEETDLTEAEEAALIDSKMNRNKEFAWNRLQFLFPALARAVASVERPVIFYLDDLQWIDNPSLEMLQVLMRDLKLSNFMFVGAYRSDEVQEFADDHPLKDLLAFLRGKTVVDIELGNLSAKELGKVVQSTLRITLQAQGNEQDEPENSRTDLAKEERVQALADAIYENTEGNVFFTLQVLAELNKHGHLTYSPELDTWEWDLEKCKKDMSGSVLESVTRRIQTCSEELQKILITCAYMRRTVDLESLELILTMEGSSFARSDIITQLKIAVKERFMARSKLQGKTQYSFAHDRIQQAAYEMIPEEGGARHRYRSEIGDRLYRTFNFFRSSSGGNGRVGTRDWMVLSAADHLNATYGQEQPMFLARLNLEAGQKCMAMAAYESASKYLAVGLERLKAIEDPWEREYRLAFDLYAAMTEAELLQGNVEKGRSYAALVIEHAETDMERVPTELALAKALGRQRLHKDSFEMSRQTLCSLGKYKKTTGGTAGSVVGDLLFVKRYFRSHSDEQILALPKGKDESVRMEMELYVNTSFQGWMMGSDLEFVASSLKCLRATLKHGLFPQSGNALMGYALICENVGDMAGTRRFANLSIKMLEQSDDQAPMSLNTFVKTFYYDSWSTDTRAACRAYEFGHAIGMEYGDFENGLMSCGAGLDHAFASGQNLIALDKKFSELVDKETLFRLESVKGMTTQQWMPTRFLRGTIEMPTDFDELLDYDKNMRTDGSDNYALLYAFNSRLQIGVYWGNYDFVEKLLSKYTAKVEDLSHSCMGIRCTFMAIACASLYRKTGRSDYLKKAKKFAGTLKRLMEVKGKNSWHRYVIATAQIKACSKADMDQTAVLKEFNEAIQVATKKGHEQDAALAAQLAVEYLVFIGQGQTAARRWSCTPVNQGPTDRSNLPIQEFLEHALDWYDSWGATNLVDHLKSKYAPFVQDALV